MLHTILCQIQYRINNFFTISKAKATLLLVEQIEEIYFNKEETSPYTNNIERMDLFDNTKYVEKADRKKVNLENIYSTYT